METIDLNLYGVREMSYKEMVEENGGASVISTLKKVVVAHVAVAAVVAAGPVTVATMVASVALGTVAVAGLVAGFDQGRELGKK